MNTRLISAITTLPLAAAGLFAFSGTAQAAGLTGGFNYSNAYVNSPANVTIANVNNGLIDFTGPTAAILTDQTGSFTNFYTAYLRDIDFNPLVSGQFMDLGISFGTPEPDGKDTFSLLTFDNVPAFSSQSGGVSARYNFTGIFTEGAAGGATTQGGGYIDFAIRYNTANGNNYNQVVAKYNAGSQLSASFTGLAVTTVPESSAFLGLGIAGLGLVAMSRRNKKNNIR